MSDEKQFDWTGMVLPAIIAAVGFGMAYLAWPDGVTDKPIVSLTLREVLGIIASAVAAVFGVSGIAGAIRKHH